MNQYQCGQIRSGD